jgi:hypothetical protein
MEQGSLDATIEVVPRLFAAGGLSDARRVGNRERIGFASELRCECGRVTCTATWPAAAELHRQRPECFVVVPDHVDGVVVVRAADRFFVVDSSKRLSTSRTEWS